MAAPIGPQAVKHGAVPLVSKETGFSGTQVTGFAAAYMPSGALFGHITITTNRNTTTHPKPCIDLDFSPVTDFLIQGPGTTGSGSTFQTTTGLFQDALVLSVSSKAGSKTVSLCFPSDDVTAVGPKLPIGQSSLNVHANFYLPVVPQ